MQSFQPVNSIKAEYISFTIEHSFGSFDYDIYEPLQGSSGLFLHITPDARFYSPSEIPILGPDIPNASIKIKSYIDVGTYSTFNPVEHEADNYPPNSHQNNNDQIIFNDNVEQNNNTNYNYSNSLNDNLNQSFNGGFPTNTFMVSTEVQKNYLQNLSTGKYHPESNYKNMMANNEIDNSARQSSDTGNSMQSTLVSTSFFNPTSNHQENTSMNCENPSSHNITRPSDFNEDNYLGNLFQETSNGNISTFQEASTQGMSYQRPVEELIFSSSRSNSQECQPHDETRTSHEDVMNEECANPMNEHKVEASDYSQSQYATLSPKVMTEEFKLTPTQSIHTQRFDQNVAFNLANMLIKVEENNENNPECLNEKSKCPKPGYNLDTELKQKFHDIEIKAYRRLVLFYFRNYRRNKSWDGCFLLPLLQLKMTDEFDARNAVRVLLEAVFYQFTKYLSKWIAYSKMKDGTKNAYQVQNFQKDQFTTFINIVILGSELMAVEEVLSLKRFKSLLKAEKVKMKRK